MSNPQIFAKAHAIANRFRNDSPGPFAGQPHEEGQPWFTSAVKNDGKGKVGELYIYDFIGASFWGGGISHKMVQDALDGMRGVDGLHVYINSEGGDVFEGKGIYNSIVRFAAKDKTVHVDGIAASAASVIAMAGKKIITAENATWMMHQAWGGGMGYAADMRKLADILDMENEAIVGIYVARTGNTPDQVRAWMDEDTWFNAQTAKDRKFTDEIEPNNTAGEDAANAKAAARMPAYAVAAATQERIAAYRPQDVLLARMSQRVISNRASPAQQQQQRDGQPSRGGVAS